MNEYNKRETRIERRETADMKILIVDDEDYTREGLMESIDWDAFGIDEVMQASNGQEALKTARWFHPDIVLTDIRMPKMDGIAFARELLESNKESRVIFISGYMEIEYLKSAIQLSVVDYIEKPIDLAALRKALAKAVSEIKEKQWNQQAVENQRDIQQQTLMSLLCSKESDVRTIEKLARETGFPLNTVYVCIFVQHSAKQPPREGDMGKILRILQSRQGKALGRYDRDKRQFQTVLSLPKGKQYQVMPICSELLEAFPETWIGAGMETDSYRNICKSCRTAAAAVNCAFYQHEQRIFRISEEIQRKSTIEPGIYGEFLQVLSGSPSRLKKWFQELFEELRKNIYCPKEHVCTLMISLLAALYGKYPELYGRDAGITAEEQIQPRIANMASMREMEQLLDELLSWIQVRDEEKEGFSRIVQGAIDYVAQHYGEKDLSVAQIAECLHFSPAYLNVLFKQEMKMTIKQYLNAYRLERAKLLLEKDFGKVTEIAEKCGYANANYFAKVFREATGMTPAEYRKR